MSKTSDIKDRLLALSGYIRARHAATLLGCNPRTVVRNKYEGMAYGSVWYVNWQAVLATLGPDAVKALKLPDSAFVALDAARGFTKPTETVKECNDYLNDAVPNFVEKANAAIAKATEAIEKAAVPKPPLSVSVAATESTVEEIPILAMPTKREEVLTLEGVQLVAASDLAEPVAKVELCQSCHHAVGYHKTKFGSCKFAKGTIAACTCLVLV